MRSRRKAVGFAGSLDSFLDIVTNGLGMLILISTITTVSSRETLGQFKRNLGTPLVKEVRDLKKVVAFECRGGRINAIEFDMALQEINEFLDAYRQAIRAPGTADRLPRFAATPPKARLEELARRFNGRALANDFYSFEFKTKGGDPMHPDEPTVLLRANPKALGYALEEVQQASGRFQGYLKKHDPKQCLVLFFVRPDSFEFFRNVREIVQREGFRIAWHPDDQPLFIGPFGGGLFEG